MQILKIVLAASAACVCVIPGPLSARDTDAQIKAREALERKLSEGQPQTPAVTNQPPAAAPKAKAKTTATPSVAPAPTQGTAGGRPLPPGSTTTTPMKSAPA